MSGLTGLNPYGALNVTSSYKEGDISEKDVEELLEGRCLYKVRTTVSKLR